jgi:CDP-diacylglycerol--glycerol-3-phosphate 3-phosphatidyltransferase
MTTANKITILRILLIPFFVVELIYYIETGNEIHHLVAVLLFAVTAILDGVDGYIARHYNQRSELGAILDPLADKLLLMSGIITLSCNHGPYLARIPLWFTGTIIGRDLLVLIGIVVVRFTVGKVIVRPRIIGKIATVLQMTVVIWILMKWGEGRGTHWLDVWMIGAAVCTGVSGLLYVWDGVKQLGSYPASLASEPQDEHPASPKGYAEASR